MNPALRRWLTHPGVLFALAWAVLLAVLFAPLLAGGVIVNPLSDGKDGYVTRHFAATVIAAWGEIPRWDPYIFGGQPFLGAMYGDQAYPISIMLRAIFPPALGIGLGMVLHLWLGAVGMLAFLRRLRHEWTAAIVGAAAYGLGGPLIGLLFPGHDGKIFVLGLLPWGLLAVLEATRTARTVAFAGWGTVVGLMLLSPHHQMTYYFSLLAAGWIGFLLFTETPRAMRVRVLAGFAIASALALLLAGAQLVPFLDYLPYSPRSAAGSTTSGWAFATSYSLPALELIGTAWGGFNGWHPGTYWGTNFFKLHSDYLGLLVVVLAAAGVWGGLRKSSPNRRMTWFWVGATIVGTLWALGGQTPFYRLPYTFLPGISKTRAPGMIWGHVSACVAVLAAMGFARLQAMTPEDRSRWARRTLIIAGTAAGFLALAAPGMIRALASSQRYAAAVAAIPGAQWGILLGGFTVVAFALIAWRAPRWLPHAAVLMIATDLIIQDRRFIVIDPRGAGVFAPDQVVQAIQRDATGTTQPWRVLPWVARELSAYMDDYLIEHRIRSVLGYHGNEQHRYDELLGGKNEWTRLRSPLMWRHLAVRYVLTNQPVEAPGVLIPVAGPAVSWLGDTAWVYRVANPAPWARVVPVAFRARDEDVHQLVVAPQFDPDRAVLVPPDAPFGTDPTSQQVLPPAITSPVKVTVTERQPGVYVLALDSLKQDAVLVVSENWLPAWSARVDGRPAPVARANGTFMAVQVQARSREVVLTYEAPADRRGRMASFAGLGGLLVLALAGVRLKKPAQAA